MLIFSVLLKLSDLEVVRDYEDKINLFMSLEWHPAQPGVIVIIIAASIFRSPCTMLRTFKYSTLYPVLVITLEGIVIPILQMEKMKFRG